MLGFHVLVNDRSTFFAETDNNFFLILEENFPQKFFVRYSRVTAKDRQLLCLIRINVFFITFLSIVKRQNIKLNLIYSQFPWCKYSCHG